MKKLFFALVLAFMMCGNAFSQRSSTSMAPIMSKAEDLVQYLEREADLEIVRMEYDILRNTKTTTRMLSSGWTYTIIAFGDYRFRDIDVRVYKKVYGEWQLVESDNDTNAVAIVNVTPQYDGEYLIEIKAYSFEPGYDVGHYGLIIAHE